MSRSHPTAAAFGAGDLSSSRFTASTGFEPTASNSSQRSASPAASVSLSAVNTALRVIITGSTGMVGEGVLHECLRHPAVEAVLILNRRPLGLTHPKLKEIVHPDFYDLSGIESQLAGYNACFFCLGVSSVGMPAEEYYKVTYTLTMHVAGVLSRLNPLPGGSAAQEGRITAAPAASPVTTDRTVAALDASPTAGANPAAAVPAAGATAVPAAGATAVPAAGATAAVPAAGATAAVPAAGATAAEHSTSPESRSSQSDASANPGPDVAAHVGAPGNMVFAYVSGAGTDSTERGRLRWARVKGKTENDLMLLPFRRVYAFRPGFIKAIKGLHNTNPLYKYVGWMFPIGRALYPGGFVTLSEVGLAMIHLALHCDGDAVVSGNDIIRYAAAETADFSSIATGR